MAFFLSMILLLYLHNGQCYGDSKHLLVETESANGTYTYNDLPSVKHRARDRGGQDYQYQYGETMSGEDGGNAGTRVPHTMAYNNNPDYKISKENWEYVHDLEFEFKIESFGSRKQPIMVVTDDENSDICLHECKYIFGFWIGRHHGSI